jgi:hypothetical protein
MFADFATVAVQRDDHLCPAGERDGCLAGRCGENRYVREFLREGEFESICVPVQGEQRRVHVVVSQGPEETRGGPRGEID